MKHTIGEKALTVSAVLDLNPVVAAVLPCVVFMTPEATARIRSEA